MSWSNASKMFSKALSGSLLFVICLNISFAQAKKVPMQAPELVFAKSPEETQKKLQSERSPYYLVKVKPGLGKSVLRDNNVEIIRHLNNGYAIIKSDGLAKVKVNAMFDTVLLTNDRWKLSDALLNTQTSIKNAFTIRTAQGKALSVLEKIAALGFEPVHAGHNILFIKASLDAIITQIIPMEDVQYVGVENHNPTVESRVLDLNLEPNTINHIHHTFPDLSGDGITVSIKELSYNPNDIDLDGRHVPSALSSNTIDNHATEMATIIAGAGNSFITGRGVAKSTALTSSNFINLFPDEDEEYELLNAWVQNHSYGTVIENVYGALAESFDLSANRNPELLHILSSGNKGNETSQSGNYQGIPNVANITGNFKMAKNVLVVGSVDTVGRQIAFSSRGPAYDGRIKPEVVAYSTAGSSNSAAIVSGVALLLQQQYLEMTDSLPDAALLKALLINSANDVGAAGIDFITGYGNVDAYKSLTNLKSGYFVKGTVDDGETDQIVLPIPPDATNLKVTLVWNDPAAPVNSVTALTNDLDMVLTDPSDTDWLPWVLDSSPDITKLTLPATRAVDNLNNIEQVTLESPPSGDFTMAVTGFDIPFGPQDYYIAYQWDTLNHFEWSFPTGSDNMPYNGETGSYFRWKSTLPGTTGKLEYSVDDGGTWIVINESVNLEKGYYRWMPPELNSSAVARMVVDSETFPTDIFTISRPVVVTVGFNCADSIMLQWKSLPNAVAYDLFSFNDMYLESILTTPDTSVVLYKNEFPSTLHAVQPVVQNNKRAIRSLTYDYEQQGVECFVLNFYVLAEGLNGIRLTLQLGTLYGVDEIWFERMDPETFELIEDVSVFGSTMIQYLDTQPLQGLNIYRARIKLQNGEEVVTEPAEIFFLSESPYAIFPNPVGRSTGLNINSGILQNPNGILRMYKTDGGLAQFYQLSSDREVIDVSDLNPGLYFYSIESGNRFYSGKIAVIDD